MKQPEGRAEAPEALWGHFLLLWGRRRSPALLQVWLEGRGLRGLHLRRHTNLLDTLGSTVKVSLDGILMSAKVLCDQYKPYHSQRLFTMSNFISLHIYYSK